ncbi:DUF2846 domain-containing protein [Candidatus Sulfurimonas baltica]|uniref:DUF2846 domain-containing protein n=1 Tax=Candidatus Sulfurimonas baltica TaxID=2740404 RepID=A0A7S7RMW3_9BACT|nr:DUF2846 domain-containing protein [Candidatus Sulfurimonas baltica]QOY51899.1 DUF2846 domain-containing protein [Candidatus Sulfurimonas baltica]
MKNILIKATILITVLMFTACGTKVPFKKEEPLQGAALVYVYVPISVGSGEDMSGSSYKIRVNNKRIEGRIIDGEYKSFNLKPNSTTISTTRNDIQEQALKIDFKAGETYYLKVVNNSESATFELVQVDSTLGLKEIAKTGLAGSRAIEVDNILTELVEEDPQEEAQIVSKPVAKKVQSIPATTSSKMDEVKKAYQLKVDGILTEDEFTKLKAEILAK